jgi:hypothetical protein
MNMLTASYDNAERIVLNVEDGLYYLNGGCEDIRDWSGIEFQIEDYDMRGVPQMYTYAIAKADKLDCIKGNEGVELPVYEFKNGVGTYRGYYALGCFGGSNA